MLNNPRVTGLVDLLTVHSFDTTVEEPRGSALWLSELHPA
jgi:hypothetical protein